uniref:Lipoprotein n=1 Tax=Candidatus Kentrum sp. TUN TaxID=2126343 RepID=A0A451A643_9GAMM|nr:MAG: hypothetical protein BECKTUN1418D_GA0071000_11535 [Candidatus Kentron sp. TUN]
MKLFVGILLGLLLVACSVTTQKATKTSGIDTMNTIIGSFATMGVTPPEEPPDRVYQGISATALYDLIHLSLTESDFKIDLSNRDIGEIRGRFEKEVVKKLWRWKQRYYAHFELKSELENKNTTVMYYYFWVKEKSPSSRIYVKVESPDEGAEQMRDALLLRIDQYVTDNGGRF